MLVLCVGTMWSQGAGGILRRKDVYIKDKELHFLSPPPPHFFFSFCLSRRKMPQGHDRKIASWHWTSHAAISQKSMVTFCVGLPFCLATLWRNNYVTQFSSFNVTLKKWGREQVMSTGNFSRGHLAFSRCYWKISFKNFVPSLYAEELSLLQKSF